MHLKSIIKLNQLTCSFFFFFSLYFLLEYNCFTMLCLFLLEKG